MSEKEMTTPDQAPSQAAATGTHTPTAAPPATLSASKKKKNKKKKNKKNKNPAVVENVALEPVGGKNTGIDTEDGSKAPSSMSRAISPPLEEKVQAGFSEPAAKVATSPVEHLEQEVAASETIEIETLTAHSESAQPEHDLLVTQSLATSEHTALDPVVERMEAAEPHGLSTESPSVLEMPLSAPSMDDSTADSMFASNGDGQLPWNQPTTAPEATSVLPRDNLVASVDMSATEQATTAVIETSHELLSQDKIDGAHDTSSGALPSTVVSLKEENQVQTSSTNETAPITQEEQPQMEATDVADPISLFDVNTTSKALPWESSASTDPVASVEISSASDPRSTVTAELQDLQTAESLKVPTLVADPFESTGASVTLPWEEEPIFQAVPEQVTITQEAIPDGVIPTAGEACLPWESSASTDPVTLAEISSAPEEQLPTEVQHEMHTAGETETAETLEPSAQPADSFASSGAPDPLPWEEEPTTHTTEETAADPYASAGGNAAPPCELSEPVERTTVDEAPDSINGVTSKLATLELDDDELLEDPVSQSQAPGHIESEAAPETHTSELFAQSGEDFTSLIGVKSAPEVDTKTLPKSDKFSFLADSDDDLLDDDIVEDVSTAPAAAGLQQTSNYSQAPATQHPQVQSQQFVSSSQQYQSQSQYYKPEAPQYNLQSHQIYNPQNPYAMPATPHQAQHHLDIQKLNENKKRSDAYDFPADLMPHKQVHRPAKAQSSAQLNDQYLAHQVGAPPVTQPPIASQAAPVPPANPYAPQTHLAGASTPGLPSNVSRTPSYASTPAFPPPVPPVIKKKQSSFFEELPLPPIAARKARAPTPVSQSPMMGGHQPYGLQHNNPAVPPKGPSRPPSRRPVVAQRTDSVTSTTSSPLISSVAPAGGPGSNQYGHAPLQRSGSEQPDIMYAPSQAPGLQEQGNRYAPPPVTGPAYQVGASPKPSRYAPQNVGTAAPPTGLGMMPPVQNQQSHYRRTSNSSNVISGQTPQSPQPQLSHMIGPQNPYAAAAMSGQAVPLTSSQALQQPGIHALSGLPQVHTSAAYGASLAPPGAISAGKSPNQLTVTPSSTKYAPINHKRQASSSAAQYDPFSAHKVQQKKQEEDHQRVQQQQQQQQQQGYPQKSGQAHAQSLTNSASGMVLPAPSMSMTGLAPTQRYEPQPSGSVSQGYAALPQQALAPQQMQDNRYPQHQPYALPTQYEDAAVQSNAEKEGLRSARQFPLFSWGNGAKLASFVASTQYGAQSGIRVLRADAVLQDATLKDFPSLSKRNVASVIKFLNNQLERIVASPNGANDAELLLVQLLKHKLSKSTELFNLGGAFNYKDSGAPSVSNVAKIPLNKRLLVAQIAGGQKQEALNLALSHSDFGLALLISSIMSKDSWFGIVESYLGHEFSGDENHFLPLLFRILTGDIEKVMQLFETDPQRKSWALVNWKAIATAVITNQPPCLGQFLSMFGKLLIDNGLYAAGFTLFMVGDAPLSAFQGHGSITLTIYLEIYSSILQESGSVVELSSIHLQHALFLADYNMFSESQKYLDSANSAFKASKRVDPTFTYTAKVLADRLSGAGIDGSWFAKPKLDRVWGTLDKGLNKLIAGEEIKSDTKEGIFSKFSPSISRSSSYVSMSAAANPDFQSYPRPTMASHGSSPYASVNSNGTHVPVRAYTPSSTRGPAAVGSFGAPIQGYAPPHFPNKPHSSHTSPKPSRADSTTTSPLPKTSKYAVSMDSQSRTSSVQSHTGGVDDLPMKAQPQNGLSYQPAQALSGTSQLGSPSMIAVSPVPHNSQRNGPTYAPPNVSANPSETTKVTTTPTTMGGPPRLTTLKSGPPKAGASKGGPRAARSDLQTGVSPGDLVVQGTPGPSGETDKVNLVQIPASVADHVPGPQGHSTQPIIPVADVSFTSESTLQQSQMTAAKKDSNVGPTTLVSTDDTVTAQSDAQVDRNAVDPYGFDSQAQMRGVSDGEIETAGHHGGQVDGDVNDNEEGESEIDNYNDSLVEDTPVKESLYNQSQTQSEMGSSTATPYVVPDVVLNEPIIEEHDIPDDLQERIPESREPSQAALFAANPYAPSQAQHTSPYTQSTYSPAANGSKPAPKKSKTSDRFIPKSCTPASESTTAPSAVAGDLDFYSINGYRPCAPPVTGPVSQKPMHEEEEAHKEQHQAGPQQSGAVNNFQHSQQPVDERQPQSPTFHSRQPSISSITSPVNPYAPSQFQAAPPQTNFGPYQPASTAGADSSRSSSFSVPQQIVSPQESRFAPLNSFDQSSAGSSISQAYEPPSAKVTSYEPPKTHTITSIPEDDEVYDDLVEDEDDSDDDMVSTSKSDKSEKKRNKSNADSKDKSGGWFPFWKKNDNGPKVFKAKLGEESKFYYDEKLGRWINKNLSAEEQEAAVAKPPPPPIIKKKPSTIGKPRSESMNDGASPSTTAPTPAGPLAGASGPGMVSGPSGASPRPPPAPRSSAGGVSDLDSLLSAGTTTRRTKKKPGRGYVNVMNNIKDLN